MMITRVFTLVLLILLLTGFSKQYIFQKVSMEMETRSASAGKSARMRASVYYSAEGKMVSYYTEPQDIVIVNNKKGEITIYNPADNTFAQQQNFMLGTETSQVYFFMENKKNDLGLSAMGYTLNNTKFEDGLKVTEWNPPMMLSNEIKKVELVHEKGNPIFMAYYNTKGDFIKKMYFYNYLTVSEYIVLPTSITQIDFRSKSDSVVTKTVYSQIKLNQLVADEKFDFVIPSNARAIIK